MKTLKFKTNINCMGCLSKVTPVLDQEEGIEKWEVNLKDPDKTLQVETTGLSAEELKKSLKRIGFEADEISG